MRAFDDDLHACASSFGDLCLACPTSDMIVRTPRLLDIYTCVGWCILVLLSQMIFNRMSMASRYIRMCVVADLLPSIHRHSVEKDANGKEKPITVDYMWKYAQKKELDDLGLGALRKRALKEGTTCCCIANASLFKTRIQVHVRE